MVLFRHKEVSHSVLLFGLSKYLFLINNVSNDVFEQGVQSGSSDRRESSFVPMALFPIHLFRSGLLQVPLVFHQSPSFSCTIELRASWAVDEAGVSVGFDACSLEGVECFWDGTMVSAEET